MNKTYEFSIVLKGLAKVSDDLADALFAAGCVDGTPGSCGGVARVVFDREAETLEAAIRAAISHVQAAGCMVDRVEIEAEAASLLNV